MTIASGLRGVANGHPFATGLVLTAAYFVVFSIPQAFSSRSFGRGRGIEEADDAINLLPLEIALVASLVAIIALLAWWRETGLSGESQGGTLYAAPAMLLSAFFLVIAGVLASQSDEALFSVISPGTLATLALITFLVGLFEEMLFRGVLQHGAIKAVGEIGGVLVVSFLFGVMHYVNWVNGQPLAETHMQVFHAGTAGILYGALRLRTGVLWPSVVVHAVWDFSVFTVHTVIPKVTEATEAAAPAAEESALAAGGLLQFVTLGFEPLLGLFILWRWWVWKKRKQSAAS